ncbi:MAG: GlxA family transcriptional regulator [Beijerinckiaceae bacterium]
MPAKGQDAAGPGRDAKPRRIAMLIYPGAAPLDFVGPLQVFDVANGLRRRMLYEIFTVAAGMEPVATPLGISFVPACTMADVPLPLDTLLVSGARSPDFGMSPEIFEWLRHVQPKARRFGSICTGAFVLAAAGLATSKRMTTHWMFCSELARRHPEAKVEVDPIYVRDGTFYSSAGISAGIDLALALVEEDHGRDFALAIARHLVLPLKRSGGQAQFSPELQAQYSTDPAIEHVQLWCYENLAADLRVPALAERAGMKVRSFARLFHEQTGDSPGDFVASARLQAARRLLEERELPLKMVASRCGLGSVAGMRRVFLRELGVSPAAYRAHFHS